MIRPLIQCLRRSRPVVYNHSLIRNVTCTHHCQMPQKHVSPYPNTWKNKFRRRIGLLAISRDSMIISSADLYIACTDALDTPLYFKEWQLSDTFFSWFLVTQLHVWILLCRAMRDGPEGMYLRNQICNRLWEDTDSRLRRLDSGMGYKRRREVEVELGQFFRAFLISMDAGLLIGDKELAGAIWRNIYGRNCPHPRLIENIIQYTRTQVDHVMSLDKEVILRNGELFMWAPFEPFHKF